MPGAPLGLSSINEKIIKPWIPVIVALSAKVFRLRVLMVAKITVQVRPIMRRIMRVGVYDNERLFALGGLTGLLGLQQSMLKCYSFDLLDWQFLLEFAC